MAQGTPALARPGECEGASDGNNLAHARGGTSLAALTTVQTDLAVLGAGAKATAIATKVHAINSLGLGSIEMTVLESTEAAATWSGVIGYTTGAEYLALTPAKDVGFPYQSVEEFGEEGLAIDAAVMELSWHRYLIDTRSYARWIDAGSPPVQHREYGRYLNWVLSRARQGVSIREGRVLEVGLHDSERWSIEVQTADGPLRCLARAFMLTGPGIHRDLPHDPRVADRIFHCDSRRPELARIPAQGRVEIAIVGGGESALASILYLLGLRPEAHLTIYTPSLPMSRGESFVENRIFSTPDVVSWESLPLEARREFINRCDRGVFGPDGMASIAYDERCSFVTGRVTDLAPGERGERVRVEYESPLGPGAGTHDYAVNCIGFDLLEQLRVLLTEPAQAEIQHQVGPLWGPDAGTPEFGRNLELKGMRPMLHIPGLSSLSQGPGFSNLGCMGLVANRVVLPLAGGAAPASNASLAGEAALAGDRP